MGKKISELTNRQQLSGNEDLPFQEGQDNGSFTISSIANNSGKTEDRPTNADKGFQYYDTDINKPIWWNGFSWTDASGTTV